MIADQRPLKLKVVRVFDVFVFLQGVELKQKTLAQIDDVFDFAPEAERAKIRGGNAMKLFKFKT